MPFWVMLKCHELHTHFCEKKYFWKWGETQDFYLKWGGGTRRSSQMRGLYKCSRKGGACTAEVCVEKGTLHSGYFFSHHSTALLSSSVKFKLVI